MFWIKIITTLTSNIKDQLLLCSRREPLKIAKRPKSAFTLWRHHTHISEKKFILHRLYPGYSNIIFSVFITKDCFQTTHSPFAVIFIVQWTPMQSEHYQMTSKSTKHETLEPELTATTKWQPGGLVEKAAVVDAVTHSLHEWCHTQ
jgi:hypothetical protein